MTGVSSLGQVLEQIERFKSQQLNFSTLSTQLATGKKTQVFTGLGTDVLTSKRSRADFTSLDTYINNIKNADRRLNLMLKAVEEFKAQAENFHNALIGLSQESTHTSGDTVYWDDPTTPNVVENVPVGVDTATMDTEFGLLQDMANNIFGFFEDLLNRQDNDRYLFSGAETLTKPLSLTGTLDAAISTLVTGWKGGTITTTELIADLQDRTTSGGNTNALTDTIIGYNSALSAGTAGKVFIRVDDTTDLDYTTLANDQAFRDILVAVSYFKNGDLPPIADEVYIDPNTGLPVVTTEGAPGADTTEMKQNFYQVYNQLATMVANGMDRIDQLRFDLEDTRARIASIKEDHTNSQNLLLNTISDVEDVDINEVAVKISTLQVQLEASFAVTARVQQLSLVNFIF